MCNQALITSNIYTALPKITSILAGCDEDTVVTDAKGVTYLTGNCNIVNMHVVIFFTGFMRIILKL